ncbi:MAG: LapA family protein [Gammaproteobacteria bacterium]|nr:LapA family protein [Gammaproteobacteria bacterium]
MSRYIQIVLVGAILVFGFAFHLRNGQFVTLDYYADSVTLPFSLWVFIWLTIGVCLGLLAIVPLLLRLRSEISRLRRQLRRIESEAAPAGAAAAGNAS